MTTLGHIQCQHVSAGSLRVNRTSSCKHVPISHIGDYTSPQEAVCTCTDSTSHISGVSIPSVRVWWGGRLRKRAAGGMGMPRLPAGV